MTEPDPRLNAYRPDLADIRLQGRVKAERFVRGEPSQVTVPVADLRREPRPDCGIDSQLLFGETVDVFDEIEGWCWVQAHSDRYVGHVAAAALTGRLSKPTHRVTAPRTFIYPGPDMKMPAEASLSIGSMVEVTGQVETRGTKYLVLKNGGAIFAGHLSTIETRQTDPVEVAVSLLKTPYLWGGRSGHGIDCSGLVQLSHSMCGISLDRDTSRQVHTAGHSISDRDGTASLQRGDLVFWNGHVAMMFDSESIIHANGHAMAVTIENYTDAARRIEYLYDKPVAFRRI